MVDGISLCDGIHHSARSPHDQRWHVFHPTRGILVGDEELAAIGEGTCIGHTQNARTRVFQVRMKFIFETIAGTTATGTGWYRPWIMKSAMTRWKTTPS